MTGSIPWWGEFPLAEHQAYTWSMGERQIVIQRLKREWNTWHQETAEESKDPGSHAKWTVSEIPNTALPDNGSLGRHLQTSTSERIRILPALADRSIVTRPNVPLRLLSGEQARIYVSTPVWFQAITLPDESCFLDIPFWRPSDSWFGPSTMEGELCYAKYTDARSQLERLEQRPHRAITPVQVHNKQKGVLLIERLNVPVPLLSLYNDANRGLWTDTITVIREAGGDAAELRLEKQAPAEVEAAQLVTEARVASEKRTLIRSIGSLFA